MHFFKKNSQKLQQTDYMGSMNTNSEIMKSINGKISQMGSICTKSVTFMNQFATNLVYHAKNSGLPIFQRKQIVLGEMSDPVILLGRKYQFQQAQQFLNKFSQIVWFSYRSGTEGRTGDAGWGCMIRVCQMLLAEALKRTNPKYHISQIVNEFSEDSSSLFNFDKICSIGKIDHRWTSSTQILSILKKILAQQTKFDLSIQIYSSAAAFEDLEDISLTYPLIICINNRIGQNNITKQYHDNVFALMQHPKSIGVIGGVGGQAVYIVGYQNKDLIVMDPHYIQTQKNGESIHFKKTPRGLSIQKIVPSVSFCYLIQSRQEHRKWLQDMAEIAYFHYPYSGIEFDREISRKIYEQRHPKMSDSDQDQFQVLQ